MRPTLVHVVRDPEISGSQRVAFDILGAPGLSAFRRVIICGSEASASKQFLDEADRLGVERIHVERLSRDVGSQDLRAFLDLQRALKALKPVLVHTHSAKPYLLAGLAAWLLRVPRRIYTVHGITFHRFTPVLRRQLYYLLEQLGSLLYHRIVSVNNYYCRYFPLARARHKIQVIPNGISLRRQEPRVIGERGGEFPILFAGRFDEQKDPLFVLDVAEAIGRYWKSDLTPRFYLAGSGPLSGRVAAEIVSRGLTEKVIPLGWVADLSDQYASAKALFLPSRWEACGLVLIEAAALGCPAVASDVEGIPEVIRDGHNGLLFQQGDLEAACQCLARIAQDEAFRRRLAENARIEAQHRDIGTMTTRYLDLYRSLGLSP